MLKPAQIHNPNIPITAFTEFNKKIFFDENIREDEVTPIINKEKQYIQTQELKETLRKKFKANRSSGLSQMPL